MFKYWQGYEIDGSDTSYNLIMPEKAQCVEVVKYFLQLKTIQKYQNFEVLPYKKGAKYTHDYREKNKVLFSCDQLEELGEYLLSDDFNKVIIFYKYVVPENLYPEVKREIIDIIASFSGVQNNQFHNPVLFCDYQEYDSIELIFSPVIARAYQECSEQTSAVKYIEKASKKDFYIVEIVCSLGASFGIVAYNYKKLAERFPELQLNSTEKIQEMYANYHMKGKEIYEQIKIPTKDFVATLKQIVAKGDFYFQLFDSIKRTNVTSKELLSCYFLPNHSNEENSYKWFWQHYDTEGNLLAGIDNKNDQVDI